METKSAVERSAEPSRPRSRRELRECSNQGGTSKLADSLTLTLHPPEIILHERTPFSESSLSDFPGSQESDLCLEEIDGQSPSASLRESPTPKSRSVTEFRKNSFSMDSFQPSVISSADLSLVSFELRETALAGDKLPDPDGATDHEEDQDGDSEESEDEVERSRWRKTELRVERRVKLHAEAMTSTKFSKNKFIVPGSMEFVLAEKIETALRSMDVSKVDDEHKSMARRFVDSDAFDYAMGAVLVLNAIVVGIATDVVAHNLTADDTIFKVLNYVFVAIFTLELLTRVIVFGLWDFLTEKGWRWNVFDVIIVGFSIVDIISALVVTDPRAVAITKRLGVLRILRLGRIIRLVRLIRLIPALKSIVGIIQATMTSFVWVACLYIMLVYCVAIYFTYAFVDVQAAILDATGKKDPTGMRPWWGDIGFSMVSVYGSSSGATWTTYLDLFLNQPSSIYVLHAAVMAMYVAVGLLILRNIVTGVCVQQAAKMMRDDKENDMLQLAVNCFRRTGKDPLDGITLDDVKMLAREGVFSKFNKIASAYEDDLPILFHILDKDNSEKLQVDEIAFGLSKCVGDPSAFEAALITNKYTRFLKLSTAGLYSLKVHLQELEKAVESCAARFRVR